MINQIKAKNFKIVEFIDLKPKKGVNFIVGPNGAGKSTVMDLIETMLVGGKKILNPVKDGADKAYGEIKIGDYTVKKTFTEKSVRLEVFDKEDNKVAGGLSLLETIVNKIGFEPTKFINLKPKDQREQLMNLLKIDFTVQDKKREELFEERHDIGVEKKTLPIYESEEIKAADEYMGIEEKSISELSEKYNHELTINRNYKKDQNQLIENKSKIEELKNEMKAIEEANNVLSKTADTTEDLEKLRIEVDNAEETNRRIRNAKEIMINSEKFKELTVDYDGKTKSIETIDTFKQNVLKNAKMPLEGLSITDEGVVFNDRPFEQLSTSEKIKISISVCLLLMPEDKERVILFREGNLLDDKSMDVIVEMAKSNNSYFFVEMVQGFKDGKLEIPKEGVLIKEGKVVSVDGEPAE